VSNDQFQVVTLPNGNGGLYQTTRLGLLLATVPFVVRYTFRGDLDIPFEELAVGGDPVLLERANDLTTSSDQFASVSPFTALLMMIGEYVHNLEDNGEIKPGELGALFKQIDALTAAEGVIASRVSFTYPRILRVLLYIVFFAWLCLLSLTDIGPSSGWNSLWLVGLLSLSSVGLYAMSNRYSNPFTIRSKDSTQTPLVGIACREAERAIDGVFAFRRVPKAIRPAVARS
jgi:predicted membrane chloride channel (bestrophin family)